MSSTNRGGTRNAADFYPTPDLVVDVLVALLHLEEMQRRLGRPLRILEPSAGAGAILRGIERTGVPAHVVAVEPYHRRYATLREAPWDELITRPLEQVYLDEVEPFDVVAGNPPFTHSQAHIEHCLYLLRPGGLLGFVLPASHRYGKERADRDRRFPAAAEYGLRERVSFTGGGTDSAENDVLVYRKGHTGSTLRDYVSWKVSPEIDLARILPNHRAHLLD